MLNYQPIEVLISVLYFCNTLTTTNYSGVESRRSNQSSSQTAFPQAEMVNINVYKVHSVIHTNTKHHHSNKHDIIKCFKH